MKLLADENFPSEAVGALREGGHDVLWVRAAFPGASDSRVLERATSEQRIVLTFDKDFGELAFRWALPATSGIILFRMRLASPAHIARARQSEDHPWLSVSIHARNPKSLAHEFCS
jgi:predicted nuclease of predicted toxin-antitoxin system